MRDFSVPDETFYKNIIDAMPSAVFIMDEQTKVLDWNREAANILRAVDTSSEFQLCGDAIRCTHALNELETQLSEE